MAAATQVVVAATYPLADIVTVQSNFLAEDLPHARDSVPIPRQPPGQFSWEAPGGSSASSGFLGAGGRSGDGK